MAFARELPRSDAICINQQHVRSFMSCQQRPQKPAAATVRQFQPSNSCWPDSDACIGCVHDTFMHRYKLVSGVATVCMRATYLHRVDVGDCPGGRVFNGRFGGSCCKAAHAQAGAEVAVLHLQMYAHMQVKAPGLCPAFLGAAIGNASNACLQDLASSPVIQAHNKWRPQG